MRRRLIPLLLLAVATVGTVLVGPAQAETDYIGVTMTGAEVAPNPGDPDGVGSALFT